MYSIHLSISRWEKQFLVLEAVFQPHLGWKWTLTASRGLRPLEAIKSFISCPCEAGKQPLTPKIIFLIGKMTNEWSKVLDFVLTEKFKTKSNLLLFGQTRTCFLSILNKVISSKRRWKWVKVRNCVKMYISSNIVPFAYLLSSYSKFEWAERGSTGSHKKSWAVNKFAVQPSGFFES